MPLHLEAKMNNETFSIKQNGRYFELSVSPEFRYNGTQNYDGMFHRLFKRPQDAKTFCTKQLGEKLNWNTVIL